MSARQQGVGNTLCRLHRGVLLGLCTAVMAGCTVVGPNYQTPPSPLKDQWSETQKTDFTEAVNQVRAAQLDPVAWWKSFDDPVLGRLLDLAARQNLTLQSAALRVYQARAVLGIQDASLLPSVGLAGDANRGKSSRTRSALIQANWELDLWGKFERTIESAFASYQAAIASYYAADVSLAATVANTYINIRNVEQLLKVARSNLGLQAESLRIAKARYDAGSTSLLALSQARSRYQQTQAVLPRLTAQLHRYRNALSVLLGQPPGFYEATIGNAPGTLKAPEALSVGIPKDLLRRRPDVALAEYQAASQSALIGAKQAELYPSFSLSGFFGYLSATVSYQNDTTFTWEGANVGAGVGFTFPLFYRGALVDQVRVQDAAFQQAVLNYQNTVLGAQAEVEDALIQIATSRSTTLDLARAVRSSRQAAQLAVEQYEAGETDYNTVILAQQTLLDVQSDHVQSQTDTLLGYVAAFKALGGGWSGDLAVPRLPAEMISAMSARTDWGDALSQPQAPRLLQKGDTRP